MEVAILTSMFAHSFSAMYMLTYIGGWINGLSIILGAWVGIFSVPKIYKDNQVPNE